MTTRKSEIDFDNTEYAFEYKNNFELKRAQFIFNLINFNWLVKAGTSIANKMMQSGLSFPVVVGMRPTIYAVFCGGDELEDTVEISNNFGKYGVNTVLDYGVEGKESEQDFKKTENEILKAIEFAKKNKNISIVCSKFTGLLKMEILEKLHENKELSFSEESEYKTAIERIDRIAACASKNGISLFVDAEESWIQKPLDDLTLSLMEKYNKQKPIIYNTIQLYNKSRLSFFKNAVEMAKEKGFIYGAKIVRGAYMEKEAKRAKQKGYENPIQKSKKDTDADYNEAIKFGIAHINDVAVCIATHNEESCLIATQLLQEKGIQKKHPHIHFSQLMGMSDNLTFNLAKNGFVASKYMPYGPVKDVIPYLIRRAQENTSVSGQMGRELALISKEIKRRKLL
jgi:proline dehydrogenase